MKCPIDGTDLTMSERQGIEIDYCPKCRGVWLDRGELDKIIDRAESNAPQAQPPQPAHQPAQQPYAAQPERYRDDRRDYRDDDRHYGHGHRKRRKSFLGEIFDFD